jgi:hypothetical protein
MAAAELVLPDEVMAKRDAIQKAKSPLSIN